MTDDKETVERQLRELTALADAGELAAALAHEVNNFLNVLLLQLAILEHNAPPEGRNELAAVRRQGKQLAELVKHWQCSRTRSTQGRPVDLNSVLQHLDFGPSDVRVRMDAAPNLPPILGVPSDVQRLCMFLVKNAISAAQQGQKQILVRTELADGSVRLGVEDTGPNVREESLAQFFDAAFTGRGGTDRLELAACRGIVRRMNGKIHAENVPDGGIIVAADLPIA